MALGFGSKAEDVMALISRKNYSRAIEVLRAQTEANSRDPRLRMQLADVLILAGKGREAVGILTPLADEFAQEGFAAKAIAVLKKIQKVDPGHRGVDARLAALIQEKQRVATVAVAATSLPEIGMEEIGFEFPTGGSIAVPAERPREPEPLPEPAAPELALEPLPSEPDAPELALEPLPVEPELPQLPPEPHLPASPPAKPLAAHPTPVIREPDRLDLGRTDDGTDAAQEV